MRTIGRIFKTDTSVKPQKNDVNKEVKKSKSGNKKKCNSNDKPTS